MFSLFFVALVACVSFTIGAVATCTAVMGKSDNPDPSSSPTIEDQDAIITKLKFDVSELKAELTKTRSQLAMEDGYLARDTEAVATLRALIAKYERKPLEPAVTSPFV